MLRYKQCGARPMGNKPRLSPFSSLFAWKSSDAFSLAATKGRRNRRLDRAQLSSSAPVIPERRLRVIASLNPVLRGWFKTARTVRREGRRNRPYPYRRGPDFKRFSQFVDFFTRSCAGMTLAGETASFTRQGSLPDILALRQFQRITP